MHAEQKAFLEDRFAAREWHGRSDSGRRIVKEFHFAGSELEGWKLLRTKETEEGANKVLRSLWSRGDNTDKLLSIDVFLSPSVKSAHETLLEALSNTQSGRVERRTDKNTVGDVAFGLANTMIMFARANLVLLIRNAGPTVVPVGGIGRELDKRIQRRLLESE